MAPRFDKPSAVTLAAATLAALAAGFVTCSQPARPRAPVAPESSAEPAAPPAVAPPAASSVEPPSAANSAPPAAPAAKQRAVVAVLGDSLTDEKSAGGKYLEVLRQRCPQSRFDNFGKGGDMVNQIRKRFERDVLTNGQSYTHLVMFGGVNDLYSDLTAGRTPAKIGADLTAIYQAAHARGWKVVALTVAPWGGFTKYYNPKRSAATRELNDWMRAQLEQKHVDHLVDAYALLSCGDAERLCAEYAGGLKDGLHFGGPGHEKLGNALFEQVFKDCR